MYTEDKLKVKIVNDGNIIQLANKKALLDTALFFAPT